MAKKIYTIEVFQSEYEMICGIGGCREYALTSKTQAQRVAKAWGYQFYKIIELK